MKHLSYAIFACVAFGATAVLAGEGDAAAEATKASGLKPIDWVLIALYAISTIGLGVYFSRRQKSTEEYFVGSGNMNPVLIGVSLFATLLSTISYLSMPGESLGKGPVTLVGLLALPLVFFIVAFGLLPVYMRNRVTSAYELLEQRLGLSVRMLGAVMFLTLRLVWMMLLVYLAAQALTVMMGVDYWIVSLDDFSIEAAKFGKDTISAKELPGFFRVVNGETLVASVPVIVLITGIVAVIYTSLGGLRAVVVTDLMQTILLFGGALLVVATVTWEFGGFGWFPTTWQDNWDTQPIFSFDPATRVTWVGTILTASVWYIATLGGDQTSVQRFMATRDASAARRALATQLTVGVVVALTLYTVGFALLRYFQQNDLPPHLSIDATPDKLFPYYIANKLPPGVSGLVVAAMFAAAMSSIDSGVNSITAVVTTDFLDRFGLRPKSERWHVITARLLALGIGLAVVLGSSLMKYIPGNITAVTNKTANLLTTPIFGLFFFALFVPFARTLAVWAGAICGAITAALIAFSGPIVMLLYKLYNVDPQWFGVALQTAVDPATGKVTESMPDPISFQWIAPLALLVNLCVGVFGSLLLNRLLPKKEKETKPPKTEGE